MVHLGVNSVSLVHDEVKYVACLQTMQQRRVFTNPLASSEVRLRRRIERENDTSPPTITMEWSSTVPKKYKNSVSVYEVTHEQSIDASISRAKMEYNFACTHFSRLLDFKSSVNGLLSCHYVVTKVDTVVYDSDAPPYCNYHLLKDEFVKKSFSKEILVFHGTTKDTIPHIISEGYVTIYMNLHILFNFYHTCIRFCASMNVCIPKYSMILYYIGLKLGEEKIVT
jgi:hypothetical protein